ncbi:MAG: rhodanese-like domain-containing protein [Calditrichaeota bacterium]|nr:MAG: rhodanese-like domain-containing protein [Calditrichota bacterium]MBL1205065.1 rhodanese-like domain-containing protein [Calditrichota bacterium]NOG44895.1 rhodanese-like domain-containing protein [Calditrichota bacterium]
MIKNINADQAKEEFDNGTEFVDVREYNEFLQVRIPGSKLIPMSEMNARFQEFPKENPVVVYCRSGSRSASLLFQLYSMGYENLLNLRDGIIEWHQKQYPMESGQPGETKAV